MTILKFFSIRLLYFTLASGCAVMIIWPMKSRLRGRGRESSTFFYCLYNHTAGRVVLKLLTDQTTSEICGKFLSSYASRYMIRPFVKKNEIDVTEYEQKKYHSFNDFFTRRILPEKRPIDPDENSLISPCDGLLSIYRVSPDSLFHIKGSEYDVSSLLKGADYAESFDGGYCLVFRLCVNNYHRYHYIDSGTKEENVFLPGVLHTVRPVALEKTNVFIQNCREYTLLHTDHFGDVAQIEIGALLVGKICNYDGVASFTRGEEKGMFLYGGSTVVLLMKPGMASFPDELLEKSLQGVETSVKMGEKIGTAICRKPNKQ